MAGELTVWTLTSARGDHKGMGCGTTVYRTEQAPYEALRDELYEECDENMFETDAEFQAELSRIEKLSNADLLLAHEEMREQRDYMWDINIQKHTLAPLPDLSTPDKVEEFLS